MKSIFKSILLAVVCLIMTSCGGVDQSNPRSVADEAIRCYAENTSNKSLFYFQDENAEKQYDELMKWADEMKAEHPERVKETESAADYEFQGFTDEFGRQADETTSDFLNYKYRSEKRGRIVTIKLKQVDGKWYLDEWPQ